MDTFMDKLAQRLNAQEIIKANVAAENGMTPAPQPQRSQDAEYEAAIRKLKETAEQCAQGAAALTQSTAKAEQSVAKTQELMEAGIDGIAENAVRTAESLNKLEAAVSRAEESLDKLEEAALRSAQTPAAPVVNAMPAAEAPDLSQARESAAKVEEGLEKISENADLIKENAVRTEQALSRMEDGFARTEEAAERMEGSSDRFEQMLHRMVENTVKTENTLGRMEESGTSAQQILGKIAENTVKAEDSMAKVDAGMSRMDENMSRMEELLSSGIAKIESMQAQGGSWNTEELQALLEELKKAQAEQFEQLSDHVHKEDVKVYRNVQAAMVDENGKQNEAIAKNISSMSGKLGAVLGVSAVALLASVAGLVFQILVYLHII